MKFQEMVLLAVLSALWQPGTAQAEYPERPVTFIVNSAPGGLGNVASRIIAEKLSEKWGRAVVIMNKSGVGGLISTN